MFPELFSARELRLAIDEAMGDFVLKYADLFESLSQPLLALMLATEQALLATPWWVVIAITCTLAYWGSRNILTCLLVGTLTFSIGFLGLWEQGMQTLALMLVAILLTTIIGIPLGIMLSYSRLMRACSKPILDVMQTLPSFVYLIPVVMLFGLGKVPALIATIIYAVAPLIRLTDLGIRLVDANVLEAADAFGASRIRKLLTVQLPLAAPNIMAGINQTTMMSLAMVVVASMIGARGLGQEVLTGINRLEIGRGLISGLGVVALAIILDRITQTMGDRLGKPSRKPNKKPKQKTKAEKQAP